MHHFDSYLLRAFTRQPQIVLDAKRLLKGVKFDTVVGRGVSGIIGATLVARALRKNLVIVRKPQDDTHSDNKKSFDGVLGNSWIFVDDMISSGKTLKAAKRRIAKVAKDFIMDTEYKGAFLYGTTYSDPSYLTPGSEDA